MHYFAVTAYNELDFKKAVMALLFLCIFAVYFYCIMYLHTLELKLDRSDNSNNQCHGMYENSTICQHHQVYPSMNGLNARESCGRN